MRQGQGLSRWRPDSLRRHVRSLARIRLMSLPSTLASPAPFVTMLSADTVGFVYPRVPGTCRRCQLVFHRLASSHAGCLPRHAERPPLLTPFQWRQRFQRLCREVNRPPALKDLFEDVRCQQRRERDSNPRRYRYFAGLKEIIHSKSINCANTHALIRRPF